MSISICRPIKYLLGTRVKCITYNNIINTFTIKGFCPFDKSILAIKHQMDVPIKIPEELIVSIVSIQQCTSNEITCGCNYCCYTHKNKN